SLKYFFLSCFFFSSRRRHTRFSRDWSSDVCSSDLVSLHIETHVREDRIHLYGFEATAERAWFTLLQTVQGVGAKVAIAILSLYEIGRASCRERAYRSVVGEL